MSTITEYVNELERDLTKARDLLHGGLELALVKLHESATATNRLAQSDATIKLKDTEGFCEASIDDVEKQLGLLNYLEAEEEVDSLEDFDKLTKPLTKALIKARERMIQAELLGEMALGKHGKMLDDAWHDLRVHIEMVRLQLLVSTNDNMDDLKELRAQLATALESAADKAKHDKEEAKHGLKNAVSGLGSIAKHVGEIIHVLFDGNVDKPKRPQPESVQD